MLEKGLKAMGMQGAAKEMNQDNNAKTMLQQALLTTVLEDLYALMAEDGEGICDNSGKGANPAD